MSYKISQVALGVPSNTLKTPPICKRNNLDIYPATPTILKSYLTTEQIKQWEDHRKFKTDIPLEKSAESLRPYQKEGLIKSLQLDNIAIFDQQRLGKTPMTLVSLSHKKPSLTIIVAPKSTLMSWKQECEKWYTTDVAVVNGPKKSRKSIYLKNSLKVLIVSYMTILLDKDIIPQPECMVIDEAHRLRNFKGVRSSKSPKSVVAIMQLSYGCKYRYALTGTPAPNASENIYPILHFLYHKLFTSYYYFVDYYYVTEEKYISRDQTIDEIVGFKPGKQRELQEFLDYISLQRKRKDYMQWLPNVDIKDIILSLDTKEQKWYNDITNTYECEELGISCENTLSQMTALNILTSKSNSKREWILSYIEDNPDDSILIVSKYTSYLKELSEIIPGSKLLVGNTTAQNRSKYENLFNQNKIKILLGNVQVVKEGMKLEACNCIIVIDPSWTYTDNEQLEDRLLPTNKELAAAKDKQQIVHLTIKDSIDEYVNARLKHKASVVDIVNNFKAYLQTKHIPS